MDFKQENIEDCYEIGEEIGSGQFARVRQCRHRSTGIEYAAKFIRKRRAKASRRGQLMEDIEREVAILKEVDHKNIVKLFEVYEDKQDVILILELVPGGELFNYLDKRDRLDEMEAATILRQILEGLKHLHDRNILHMDLKPENLMLKGRDSSQLKIIDFGFSRRLNSSVECREMVGTPEFVAPEVINYDALCLATDMWSIGVIAYILLSGYSPFLGNDKQETLSNVSAVSYSLDNEHFDSVSSGAKSFISQLLIRDPRKRATVDDCLRHPWFQSATALIPVSFPTKDLESIRSEVVQDDLMTTVLEHNSFEKLLDLNDVNGQVNGTTLVNTQTAVEESDDLTTPGVGVDDSLECLSGVVENGVHSSDDDDDSVHLKISPQRRWRCYFHSIRFYLRLTRLVSPTFPISLDSVTNSGEEISAKLQSAVAEGNLEMLRNILETSGFNMNPIDSCQELTLALFNSSRSGHFDIVEFLCEIGISVNLRNQNGDSALHLAVRFDRAEVVRCLLINGADISLTNERGQNALDIASEASHSEIVEILSRMKQGKQSAYIDQLRPTNSPRRVKVKVVGNSGTGKTKLIDSLRYHPISGFFQHAFMPKVDAKISRGNPSHLPNGVCLSKNGFRHDSSKPLWPTPSHDSYTRGIPVETVKISSSDTVSIWEFSGFEPYFLTYDWLIGDVNCLYVVVVNGSEPDEVQLDQISFWLSFIKCRTPVTTPIGFAGCLPSLPTVLLVATRADSVCCSRLQGLDCADVGQRLLPTVTQMFSCHFHIFPRFFLLNAHNPASNEMKLLRQTICGLKRTLCQSLPRSQGLVPAALSELSSWRRKVVNFPVVSWSNFAKFVRSRVNPLCTTSCLRNLVYQLQLIGEIVCIENRKEDGFVILSPSWFGTTLIGSIFSFENLSLYQPNGHVNLRAICPFLPTADEPTLLSLLESLELCFRRKSDDRIEAEFPCCYSGSDDKSHVFAMFKQNRNDYVHGGYRIVAQRQLANQVECLFSRVQIRINKHESSDGAAVSCYNFRHCSLCTCGNLRVFLTLVSNNQAIDIRSCGPLSERSNLYCFKEEICDIVCDALTDSCPGLCPERHPLSCVELKATFGAVYAYGAKDIHVAMMDGCRTVVLPGKARQQESVCDLVAFGCSELFSRLISGTKLHVSRLSVEARQSLSRAFDPPNLTGRDWCLLALLLGLADRLPSLEEAESPTDASITLWSRDSNATIDVLIGKLKELGRHDAVDALFSCLPLFVRS